MKNLLVAMKGVRLVGELIVKGEGIVRHYLLKNGQVLEIVTQQA